MGALSHNQKKSGTNDEPLTSNLKRLMQERHINEAGLSRQTGIPQPTLHKILAGKTADPRISTLQILANYFEISLDHLFTDHLITDTSFAHYGKPIPIISWADCIHSQNPVEHINPNNWESWVVADNTVDEQAYGLISRACMEPLFPKGTTLIVDPSVEPKDGDLVIVHYPNTQAATMRELSIDGPNQLLLAVNQSAEADKLTGKIKIIGTVTQSRFSY